MSAPSATSPLNILNMPAEIIHQIQDELSKVSNGIDGIKGIFNLSISCRTMKAFADDRDRLKDINFKRNIFDGNFIGRIMRIAADKSNPLFQEYAIVKLLDMIDKEEWNCTMGSNDKQIIHMDNTTIKAAMTNKLIDTYSSEKQWNLALIFEHFEYATQEKQDLLYKKVTELVSNETISPFQHPFHGYQNTNNNNLNNFLYKINKTLIEKTTNPYSLLELSDKMESINYINAQIQKDISQRFHYFFKNYEKFASYDTHYSDKENISREKIRSTIDFYMNNAYEHADNVFKQAILKMADSAISNNNFHSSYFHDPNFLTSKHKHIRQHCLNNLISDIKLNKKNMNCLTAHSILHSQFDDIRNKGITTLTELIKQKKNTPEEIKSFIDSDNKTISKVAATVYTTATGKYIYNLQAYLTHPNEFVREASANIIASDENTALAIIGQKFNATSHQASLVSDALIKKIKSGEKDNVLSSIAEHTLLTKNVSTALTKRYLFLLLNGKVNFNDNCTLHEEPFKFKAQHILLELINSHKLNCQQISSETLLQIIGSPSIPPKTNSIELLNQKIANGHLNQDLLDYIHQTPNTPKETQKFISNIIKLAPMTGISITPYDKVHNIPESSYQHLIQQLGKIISKPNSDQNRIKETELKEILLGSDTYKNKEISSACKTKLEKDFFKLDLSLEEIANKNILNYNNRNISHLVNQLFYQKTDYHFTQYYRSKVTDIVSNPNIWSNANQHIKRRLIDLTALKIQKKHYSTTELELWMQHMQPQTQRFFNLKERYQAQYRIEVTENFKNSFNSKLSKTPKIIKIPLYVSLKPFTEVFFYLKSIQKIQSIN